MHNFASQQRIIAGFGGVIFAITLIFTYMITKEPAKPGYCSDLERPIVIAEPNWHSAELNTHILKYILEIGFGCDTEIIPGGTTTIADGLIDGRFDITSELWTNTAPDSYLQAVEQGIVTELGTVFTSEEGWFVPDYLVNGPDAPAAGLTRVDQLEDYADVFPQDENGLIIFNDCATTWFCKSVNQEKFEAYDFESVLAPTTNISADGLDSSIAGAFQNKEAWLGYYWSPTKITATYNLVKLREAPYSKECWETDKQCSYPQSEIVLAGHTESLATYDPAIIAFLEQYSLSQDIIQTYLGYDDISLGAIDYLKDNQAVWSRWVPEASSATLASFLRDE